MCDASLPMQDVPAPDGAIAWCDQTGFVFDPARIIVLLEMGFLVLSVEDRMVRDVEGCASLASIIRIDADLWRVSRKIG